MYIQENYFRKQCKRFMGCRLEKPTKMENLQDYICPQNESFCPLSLLCPLFCPLQNVDISRVQGTKGTKGHKYITKDKKIKVSIFYVKRRKYDFLYKDFTKKVVHLSLFSFNPLCPKGLTKGQNWDKRDKLGTKPKKVESL
jgi:CxxC motif-containing protein